MTQGQRDGMQGAALRRDELRRAALVARGQGNVSDAERWEMQADGYHAQYVAMLAKYGSAE